MTTRATVCRLASAAELVGWDALVSQFPQWRVVHQRAWIESLRAAGCGDPLYLVFEQDDAIVGCFPGLLARVGPWRLFGSPLPGWQTVSLGPLFDPQRADTAAVMGAALPFLEARFGVEHIEVLHAGLDPAGMRALGFEGQPVVTYRAPLVPGDAARTFANLTENARRNVKRAERLGLEAHITSDERFVAEHYDQLREVYRRGGYALPFTERRVLECFRHMRTAGRLIAVAVYLAGGRVNIATGMFLLAGRELLLWMWAHRERYRWYRPTELMTWRVMEQAVARGCETFDLMGAGAFKEKFGAEPDASKMRWVWSRRPLLRRARRAAATVYHWQQTARGRAARAAVRAVALTNARERTVAPLAVVIGDVDVVRALGLAGIQSAVVAPPGDPARYSRFTHSALPWLDPAERPDALTDQLVRFAERQPQPPVLLCCDDAALLYASRTRQRLHYHYRFLLPDAALVEALVDKARFQRLAAERDLPVPPAWASDPARDPTEQLDGLVFPVIVKPLTRQPHSWNPVAGGAKAVRADTPDELARVWQRLAGAGVPLLVQHLVPGPETRIESYHVLVGADGTIVAEFTGRKIRTAPAEFGDSAAIEITVQDDVAAAGRDVVRKLGLVGIAKLDYKRGADGRLWLLEVNPRFNLWHHAGAVAGVNLPALAYGALTGASRPPLRAARAGVTWCRPWADAAAARAAGLSWWHWLRWLGRCDAWRAFARDDPAPLLGAACARLAGVVAGRWSLQPRPAGALRRSRSPAGAPNLTTTALVTLSADFKPTGARRTAARATDDVHH